MSGERYKVSGRTLYRMRNSLVQQGKFPLKLLGATLVLRTVDLLLVQSSYVPDEYWQSLEVAHKHVFGYGHTTWEWREGIRNYVYVSFIAVLYQVLRILGLDVPWLLVALPRIFQGAFSAVADVYFVRWVHERRYTQYSWAFITWLTAYFVSYCSTRTLVNTVEMNLTTIALYYFPWFPRRENSVFVFIVSFLFFLRPTSAVVWLPLIAVNLFSVEGVFRYVLRSYVPIAAVVSVFCVLVDSYFYDRFIFTPWEFFSFNVLRNASAEYGTHSFFWYFYAGIPVVLGVQTFPFYYKSFRAIANLSEAGRRLRYDTEYQVTFAVLFALIVYSVIPHKEFRFLLPLVPMMLFVSSSVWRKWSVRAKLVHIYLLAFLLIVSNFCALLFLGQFHQRGKLDAAGHLSSDLSPDASHSSILYLTPCHSLPLYSHLHKNVKTKFISCEPNLNDVRPYLDESDEFFANPSFWMRNEYMGKTPCSLPTHIVSYDNLNITNFLHINNYNLSASFFDSYFPEPRAGEYINVYKRKGKYCPT